MAFVKMVENKEKLGWVIKRKHTNDGLFCCIHFFSMGENMVTKEENILNKICTVYFIHPY